MISCDKNIAFIIPSIDFGGAELQVINQINYLVQTDSKVVLIVINKIKALREEINLPASQIFELNYPVHASYAKAILKAHTLADKVFRILMQHQIKVVLANLPFTHYLCRVVKAKFYFSSFKFHLVNYHHSLQYVESPLDTAFKKAFNFYNSFLARIFDGKNVFISESSKNNVEKFFFIKNPVIIFNSIPFKKADVTLAQDYFKTNHLRWADYTIIMPGRLHQAKGHAFFIGVLDKLVRAKSLEPGQLKVVFAGGGALEESISALIKTKGLQSFIHITGFVGNDLLLSFLANSDLVVIPSVFEGFGNVALEALMVNKLILASDAGGLKEIIRSGENGFQFRVLDDQDCWEKLNFIYENRNKELVSKEKLAEDFEGRFSFETHMRKLIQVINSCVE